MKKLLLSVALVVVLAAAAEAQVSFGYSKQSGNSSLTITYGSGYGYGCGYGYGPYGPGLVANVNGGTLVFGSRHTFGGFTGAPYGLYGTTFGGAYHGGYYGGGYYGRGLYGGHPGDVLPMPVDYTPPAPRARGVADRTHEYASAREIEEGRRRFKQGDYRGALDEFRSAVAADMSSGLAQAYFALALMATGDGRNADKALREAVSHLPFEAIDLKELFRDEREKQRLTALFTKASGAGELTAAWALSRAGDPAKLKALAGKDPAAAKLSK